MEIQPRELLFIFELKKQSSCSVRLTNNTQHYVAFKVKTTTPKKYCVRPNAGVIRPKSTRDFTITMQSQGAPPPDMVCKDKFLIQSTVVPDGTTDDDIDTNSFSKHDGKYIQENKLKVVLSSPPNSPILSPINGALNKGLINEASIPKDPVLSRVENLPPPQMVAKSVEGSQMLNGEGLKPAKVEGLKPQKDVNSQQSKPTKGAELQPEDDVFKSQELKPAKNAEFKPQEDVFKSQELTPAKKVEFKPEEDFFKSQELKPTKNAEFKPKADAFDQKELQTPKDTELKPRNEVFNIEELKPATHAVLNQRKDVIDSRELKPEDSSESDLPKETVKGEEVQPAKDRELKLKKDVEFETVNAVDELKLVRDIEDMKAKVNELMSKLSEAEVTISKLTEERRLSMQERKMLQSELELLRSNAVVKKVHVGYPLLFVCMVAFISFVVGCHLFP